MLFFFSFFSRYGRYACRTRSDCRYLQLQQSGIFPIANQDGRGLWVQDILFEAIEYENFRLATERSFS